MKELFLFVRPPRPLWLFNGPASSCWPPLAFASMAAMLRQHNPDCRVEILDAPALKMGKEAVSCAECLRLACLAKSLGAKVIAGGCFFGHVGPQVLQTGLVDVRTVPANDPKAACRANSYVSRQQTDFLERLNAGKADGPGKAVPVKQQQAGA